MSWDRVEIMLSHDWVEIMLSHDFKSNFSFFTPKFSSQNRLYKNYFLWNLGES